MAKAFAHCISSTSTRLAGAGLAGSDEEASTLAMMPSRPHFSAHARVRRVGPSSLPAQ
ncbi:hypothetical protein [Lonsdalea populi]|uniref:hypothetical protein n=2 Tax=Pectobacteriaceae TaxID=1903410 RepID=UPI001592FE2D|nr:hypothetical protein [Lonsdalea populi]QPQ23130.1 hypothetical protein I6N93_10665 [Lonsdalea populi]